MKQAEKTARLFLVEGTVQGVGFRYFAQRAARELGIAGHAKNLPDGRVEVYAVGSETQLSELARRLWAGPAFADVRRVDEQPAAVRALSSFRIEPY